MTTLVTWPTVLPAPEKTSYQWTPGTMVQRTQMDSGPARQRRLFRSAPHRVQLRWRMKNYQLSVFEAFFDNHIAHGANWFFLPIWNGSGLHDHQARFIGGYQITTLSTDLGEVSAELEIKTPRRLSNDEYQQAIANAEA